MDKIMLHRCRNASASGRLPSLLGLCPPHSGISEFRLLRPSSKNSSNSALYGWSTV